MARLDDIPTLPTNLELAGNDSFVVADKSFRGGTFAKQIPAAIIAKYSHAFLFNFNSASVKVASQSTNINVKTFIGDNTHIISEAAVIVTKAFTGLNSPILDVGSSASGNADILVDQIALDAVGAEKLNNIPTAPETDEPLLFSNGQSLRARVNAGSGKNLNEATAGQFVILVNIINVNDYIDIVPAFD